MDPRQLKVEKLKERIKRELYRKSQDKVEVTNFLDETFVVKNDGYKTIVPAHATRAMPRHIAEMFLDKVITHAINAEVRQRLKEENAQRIATKQKPMDKWEEEEQFTSTQGLRTDNMDLRRKYAKLVGWKVVERYGADEVAADEEPQAEDARPQNEQLIDELEGVGDDLAITTDDLLDDEPAEVEDAKSDLAQSLQ